MLLGDPSSLQGTMTFFGEAVGVECNEWVSTTVPLERVVEGEEAREILGVGDEGRPDYRSSRWLVSGPEEDNCG